MQIAHKPRHYFAIDFVRFLAALLVMISHYWALYYFSVSGPAFPKTTDQLPLHHFLRPVYDNGLSAVALFWLISGFVFACTYENKNPTAKEFFISRFSRLYPLHFATLIIVLLIQIFALKEFGKSQMFGNNDVYHFILNLFFISSWGFQKGLSFNGPIWSVSIEIAIYIIYFLTIPALRKFRVIGPIALIIGFYALMTAGMPGGFWACGYYFYIGVLLFTFLMWANGRCAIIGIGLIAAYLTIKLIFSDCPAPYSLPLLFSGIILFAATLDNTPSTSFIFKKIAWLGESTYGIYLCHMPFIWFMSCLFNLTNLNRGEIISSPYFLLAYIAAVLALARLSYLYIELPAKHYIRARYSRRRDISKEATQETAAAQARAARVQ